CVQLEKLREAAKRSGHLNGRKVIFHHDNAGMHMTQSVQKKLCEFSWEILSHTHKITICLATFVRV
ncbi:hypothetical protein WH47_12213, partial [Habropoda laboriosa]